MKNEQRNLLIPYDLQFFADDGTESENAAGADGQGDTGKDAGGANDGDGKDSSGTTLEEVMAELATAKAESARYKASIDKLTHENKELTSNLRQRMSATEQEELAKQEAEEQTKAYIAELEAFKRKTEAKDRYMKTSGMDAELAEKAAEAEVSGDMDALASIQKQHSDAQIKAKEAEWLGSRPGINAGDGNAYSHMSREEIMAIKDTKERQKAIALNMELFA